MTDDIAFAALVKLLTDTDRFSDVLSGQNPVGGAPPIGVYPYAWFKPIKSREDDKSDPTHVVRYVLYSLDLVAIDTQSASAQSILNDLAAIAKNKINQVALGPGCLPALSPMGEGDFNSKPVGPLLKKGIEPETVFTLTGQFAYFVNANQRATSEPPKPSGYFPESFFNPSFFGSLLT